MFRNYLVIAFRYFWKQKLFSFINLTGLSLGMACSLLIFLWIQDELRYDQFHVKKDSLFLVLSDWSYSDNSGNVGINTPANVAEELKRNVAEIIRTCRLMPGWALDNVLRVEDAAIRQSGIYADSTFFSMLTYPLTQGNPQRALVAPQSIVVSQTIAHALFDKENPLGKTLILSDSEGNREYEVTGVLADQPPTSTLQFDFILPYPDLESRNRWLTKWGSTSVTTLVELSDPQSVATVNEKIAPMIAQYRDDAPYELRLFPYTHIHLKAPFREDRAFKQGDITYIYLFAAIALLVLVVACINFINLTTARASLRATEVGIRKAVGAPRYVLIGQFMCESLLAVMLATGLGLLLVELSLPMFNQMVAKDLVVPYDEMGFIGSWLIVIIFSTILAGSYPALLLSSFNPVTTLKGNAMVGLRKLSIRPTLIVIQFAFSTILLVGTLTIYHQIQYIREKNMGLNRNNVISFTTHPIINQHFEAFRQDVLQHSAFLSISRSAETPISTTGSSSDPWWPGKTEGDNRAFNLSMVDYDFFETLGIQLIEGRSFSPQYAQDTINYILNEEAVRQMGLENPIGTELVFWRGKGQIIGVVNDFHYQSLHEKIGPIIFILWPENTEQAYVRITPGHTSQAITALQEIYARYHPDFPVDYQFLDESFDQMYRSEQRIGSITNAFTVLAIIISALGLLGMATFTAQRRRKEIGVRKVLGASVYHLLLLLSYNYLKLMLIALCIAIPLANFFLTEWLDDFAYHIAMQWWLFALPSGLLMVVALLSVGGQTLQAARQNPVDSLRDE